MKKAILLNKKEGETPLEALGRFRSRNVRYKNEKMTYAGRLDPLASGLMLVLAGEAVKEKERYAGLSKEYAFEILFGASTDTHDILGKIEHSHILKNVGMLEESIKKQLRFFIGQFRQKYPLYSSKNIKQVRKGEKPDATSHIVEVKSLKLLRLRTFSSQKLLQEIEVRIGKVQGDFRQKDILKIWRHNLKGKKKKFYLAGFYVKCGPGLYVRQLAHDLGARLGVPALAYRIKRTKIGKFAKITK